MQGCMTFFAALSGDPSLRAQAEVKIRSAVLLAPFAYIGHITAPLTNLILSSSSDTVHALLFKHNHSLMMFNPSWLISLTISFSRHRNA